MPTSKAQPLVECHTIPSISSQAISAQPVASVARPSRNPCQPCLAGRTRRVRQDHRPIEAALSQLARAAPDVPHAASRQWQELVEVRHVPQQPRVLWRAHQHDLRGWVCPPERPQRRRRHHGIAHRIRAANQDSSGSIRRVVLVGRDDFSDDRACLRVRAATGRSRGARRRARSRSLRGDPRSSSRATSSRCCRGRSPRRTRGWRRSGPSGPRAGRR